MSFRWSFLPVLSLLSVPAVASAEVLWKGDFETGDLTQWDFMLNPTKGDRKNINVVTMPVRGGTRAAEVVIHPDDLWSGNNHNRVELQYVADAPRTGEGQTTFFSFYFRLPAHAQTLNDIAYWETANSYQQSMAFWIEPKDGGTQLSFRTNHPSGMTHYNGQITINTWHQLAMQILWSQNASTGRVNVWLDGLKIVNDVAAKTKPDANASFIQVGYHRNATATPTETIYLDDAIEATTLAEVLAMPSGGAAGAGGASGGAGGASGGAGGTAGGSPPASAGAGGATAGAGGQVTAGAPGSSGSPGQGGGSGGASAGSGAGGASAGTPSTSAGAPAGGAPSGTSGAPGSAGTPSSAAGAPSSPPPAEDDGGCSFGTTGKPVLGWALAMLALGAGLIRRRRL